MKQVSISAESVMYILSAVMVLVGVLVIVFRKRKSARCSARTQATVLRVVMSRDSDDSGHQKTTYYPILEYFVNGQRIESAGNVHKSRSKGYRQGQVYGIRYNPNKPAELLMDNGKSGIGSGIVLIFIGLLIVGVTIAAQAGVFDGLIAL